MDVEPVASGHRVPNQSRRQKLHTRSFFDVPKLISSIPGPGYVLLLPLGQRERRRRVRRTALRPGGAESEELSNEGSVSASWPLARPCLISITRRIMQQRIHVTGSLFIYRRIPGSRFHGHRVTRQAQARKENRRSITTPGRTRSRQPTGGRHTPRRSTATRTRPRPRRPTLRHREGVRQAVRGRKSTGGGSTTRPSATWTC